jgi:hypothetical protein
MVNDGIAPVPGILYLNVTDQENTFKVEGALDPGYPLPGKVRQAEIQLPKGIEWRGLLLRTEIEVKGIRYPVEMSCKLYDQELGALVLRQNLS